MLEIRIHGYGGEGIVTLAELLAAAAIQTGKKVQALPSFGVERRGAPVKSCLRISDQDIWIHSASYEPDILLVLNNKLLDSATAQGIKKNGRIFLNSPHPVETAFSSEYIDATSIAIEEGLMASGVPFINVPLFGAFAAYLDIPFFCVEKAIADKWPAMVAIRNTRVAKIAYDTVRGRG